MTLPLVVMRAMRAAPTSVNQTFPSGPNAIPEGDALESLTGNSVTMPSVVILPMTPVASANQSAPSGPVVMWRGPRTVT